MVIFVTIGTGKFEELVKEVDKFANQSKEKIIIQIGKGGYEPNRPHALRRTRKSRGRAC